MDWERIRTRVKAGMKNGWKLNIVISLLILAGIIALVLQFHNEFAPKKPVIRIAAVSVNETTGSQMIWSRTICNSSQQIVDVAYSLHLLHEDTASGESEVTIPGTLTATIPPGCTNPVHANSILPTTVTPGTWQLRMVLEYTPEGGLLSLISGTSDPFEIKGAR